MRRREKGLLRILAAGGSILVLMLGGPMLMLAGPRIDLDSHWSTASRSSAGLAPLQVRDAVVQVYAARAFNWRGAFGVHTWIATRTEGADYYHVYEVTRWRGAGNASRRRDPDRAWYGSAPRLLADYRGEVAARMIPRIDAAAGDYPQSGSYQVWPGPNSNTFIAWVVRQVPGLQVHLPPTAIGKDYLTEGPLAAAPSGSGYQLSLGGVFGVLTGLEEGIEFNLLGLVLGVDLKTPALKMPGIGRLGFVQPVAGNASAYE